MSRTRLRQLSLSALVILVVGLFGFGQSAAAAPRAADPLTFTVDKAEALPGDTVVLTVTFTNNETSNVQFVYQSFQPTWETSSAFGLTYAFTDCTATAGATCGAPGGAPTYAAPIAPGASRTVTMTYQIGADSSCGGGVDIGFYSYFYYEYAGGTATKEATVFSPVTHVACPATTPDSV